MPGSKAKIKAWKFSSFQGWLEHRGPANGDNRLGPHMFYYGTPDSNNMDDPLCRFMCEIQLNLVPNNIQQPLSFVTSFRSDLRFTKPASFLISTLVLYGALLPLSNPHFSKRMLTSRCNSSKWGRACFGCFPSRPSIGSMTHAFWTALTRFGLQ